MLRFNRTVVNVHLTNRDDHLTLKYVEQST